MVNKYLKRRMNIPMKDYLSDFKEPISLEYYLLECEDNGNNDEIGVCIGYGVEVVKILSDKPVESNSFNNITHCKKAALDIINILARNTVTPIELPYVLDNIVGAWMLYRWYD